MSTTAFLNGRVRLRQLPDGYRAGVDAVLLAAALGLERGGQAVEFGCGAGAALLCAGALWPQAQLLGIEADPAAFALASANVAAAGFGPRVAVLAGDALAVAPAGQDLAFANPPFFDDPTQLRAPAPGKTAAFFNEAGIGAWLEAMVRSVRSRGQVVLIHRADALPAILAAFGALPVGAVRVLPILPFADAPAKRVLVSARLQVKTPFQLLSPLVLHDRSSDAKYTPQAEAVLRGDVTLRLGP